MNSSRTSALNSLAMNEGGLQGDLCQSVGECTTQAHQNTRLHPFF
jgi:hypothetical protein